MLFSNWYSGATLFTILVNNHSRVVSNGETFPFSFNDEARYTCSCGAYTDKCEFYRYAAAHMLAKDGRDWDRNLFVQVPRLSGNKTLNRYLNSARYDGWIRSLLIDMSSAWRRRQCDFIRAQYEFFRRSLDYSGATVYMDGMKSIRRAQYFVRENEIEMKVINLVRDGRAFCYSYVRNEGRSVEDLPEAATYWNNYIGMSDDFRKRFPEVEFLDIRYEDICRNQRKSLGRVFEFMGLDDEPFEKTRENMHILGHAMRKTFSGKIEERTEWKTDLSRSALDLITGKMETNLGRYGYI
jgi:hypothetical protein